MNLQLVGRRNIGHMGAAIPRWKEGTLGSFLGKDDAILRHSVQVSLLSAPQSRISHRHIPRRKPAVLDMPTVGRTEAQRFGNCIRAG